MAVRQYVGARYVPKFADPVAWQSGTSYEALTIVTYNNASYTSKIPVPATVGNPADNPTYWALTGNYNAQVEAYREETVAVREELTQTQNDLASETEGREQADTNLLSKINKMKILCIGDSWGTGVGASGQGWPWHLEHSMGQTVYNYCVGGACASENTNNRTTYYEELVNAHNAGVQPDVIVIAGGTNDINYAETTEAGFDKCFTYCATNFPNIPIYCIYITIATKFGNEKTDLHDLLYTEKSKTKNAYVNHALSLGHIGADVHGYIAAECFGLLTSDEWHLSNYWYVANAIFAVLHGVVPTTKIKYIQMPKLVSEIQANNVYVLFNQDTVVVSSGNAGPNTQIRLSSDIEGDVFTEIKGKSLNNLQFNLQYENLTNPLFYAYDNDNAYYTIVSGMCHIYWNGAEKIYIGAYTMSFNNKTVRLRLNAYNLDNVGNPTITIPDSIEYISINLNSMYGAFPITNMI